MLPILLLSVAQGKVLTLLLMAAALGADAMSLAVGIGLGGICRREAVSVVVTIGLFHIIMPLGGAIGGLCFSRLVGDVARVGGALLVAAIGARMVWVCLRTARTPGPEKKWVLTGSSLLLLAICTSVDAFSAGLGLGAAGYNAYLASLIFGFFGAGMTALGFYLGRKMCTVAGKYGELAGGFVLVGLAVKMFMEG